MTEKTRLKDSERRKMLVAYLRDGSVPEGFYVKVMKNDNISFRKLRPALSKEEKITRLERQIKKLKQGDGEQTTSDSSDVTESKQESEMPLDPVPENETPPQQESEMPLDSIPENETPPQQESEMPLDPVPENETPPQQLDDDSDW